MEVLELLSSIWERFKSLKAILMITIWNVCASVTKTLDDSIFPNRLALDQLILIDKTSFRPAQLNQ